MTNKYKVGDKVVCIDAGSNHLTDGKEYVVVKDTGFGDEDVRVTNDDGMDYSYYEWRFKPAALFKAVPSDVVFALEQKEGKTSVLVTGTLSQTQIAALMAAVQ